MRKTQIAVIGYNEDWCTDVAKNIAYEVGKEIASFWFRVNLWRSRWCHGICMQRSKRE